MDITIGCEAVPQVPYDHLWFQDSIGGGQGEISKLD